MILTDSEIIYEIYRHNILIKPFNKEFLGSNSYDLHLGEKLAIYEDEILDAKKHNKIKIFDIPDEGFILQPNELYLGITKEYTETKNFVPLIEGKSSTGRLGISIHVTAGFGDINFFGNWVLEITAVKPVKIYKNMPIGQIYYHSIKGECKNPYNLKKSAKYNNQENIPIESMMFKNNF